MFKKLLLTLTAVIFTGMLSSVAYAGHGAPEPEEEEAVIEPEIGYFAINPDVVTNLATLNPRDKLHYVRIKISLMIADSRDKSIIADVEPVIKDAIVSILGAKEFSQVSSNEAREKIRVECREKLMAILTEKFGKPLILDVLFLSYMYQ